MEGDMAEGGGSLSKTSFPEKVTELLCEECGVAAGSLVSAWLEPRGTGDEVERGNGSRADPWSEKWMALACGE